MTINTNEGQDLVPENGGGVPRLPHKYYREDYQDVIIESGLIRLKFIVNGIEHYPIMMATHLLIRALEEKIEIKITPVS